MDVEEEEEGEMEPGGEGEEQFSLNGQEGASLEDLAVNSRCLSQSFNVEGNPEEERVESKEGSEDGHP